MEIIKAGRWLGWMAVVFVMALPGCRDKPTPDWKLDDAPALPLVTTVSVAGNTGTVEDSGRGERLRFISHNVENWLSMPRTIDGVKDETASKPEDEKQALIAMIARHKPDILGLSEIGTPEDLEEIRDRLRAAGVDLPHLHHHQGSDPVRRLGLLSRHPLNPATTPAETGFRLAGRNFEMLRGILDVTATTPDGRDFRFLGVHLKSKREVSFYDQAQFRAREAHLLRSHVETILSEDPGARLVVFGDLNDTRRSPAVITVAGSAGSGRQLFAVPARDSRSQMWTHHWRYQDVYSRIDYIFITENLRDEADWQDARLIDDPEWRDASDHRPILLDFLPR